jgi:two-component system, NtrC family, nitrogen regulation response regulator GlnG
LLLDLINLMNREKLIRPPQIMGKSQKIVRVFRAIRSLASKDEAVIISGENGTYRELVAKTIHYKSHRHKGPFIAADLSSIPENSAEAELFGCEKGTYAGSLQKRIGKLKEADGGTIFISEIIKLQPESQKKLLFFLKSGEFKPLGGSNSLRSDVRLIAATCKDFPEILESGLVIKDLYDFFSPVHIRVPPLRERKEDILPLAKYCLKETVTKFETEEKDFSREARDFLGKYDWPGNIRELENMVKKAAILSNGASISRKDLMLGDAGSCSIEEFLEEKLKRYLREMTKLGNCNLYETVLSEVEKSLINIVLRETGGNQLKTAKTLGINRNTLRAKIKEYRIRV